MKVITVHKLHCFILQPKITQVYKVANLTSSNCLVYKEIFSNFLFISKTKKTSLVLAKSESLIGLDSQNKICRRSKTPNIDIILVIFNGNSLIIIILPPIQQTCETYQDSRLTVCSIPREGVIIDHDVIMIFPLGRFY